MDFAAVATSVLAVIVPYVSRDAVGFAQQAGKVAFGKAGDLLEAVAKRWKGIRSPLAEGLVRAGRFAEALAHIGVMGTDQYLEQIAFWAPALEKQQAGLSVSIIRESTGVAGWTDETRARVHVILQE